MKGLQKTYPIRSESAFSENSSIRLGFSLLHVLIHLFHVQPPLNLQQLSPDAVQLASAVRVQSECRAPLRPRSRRPGGWTRRARREGARGRDCSPAAPARTTAIVAEMRGMRRVHSRVISRPSPPFTSGALIPSLCPRRASSRL